MFDGVKLTSIKVVRHSCGLKYTVRHFKRFRALRCICKGDAYYLNVKKNEGRSTHLLT